VEKNLYYPAAESSTAMLSPAIMRKVENLPNEPGDRARISRECRKYFIVSAAYNKM
jgi:hypothetical protein